jgi:hypothetical protein
LQPLEAAYFHKLMRGYEVFSGLKILTYSIMDDHFHLLISVPKKPIDLEMMSDDAFFQRCEAIYDERTIAEMRLELQQHLEANDLLKAQEFKQIYFDRMYCLSTFMKCLKGRFALYYNQHNRREGVLWKERFASTIVENACTPLLTAGLYIDMNPFRAGIVADLKDYFYCGYSEARRGGVAAMNGLRLLLSTVDAEAAGKFTDEEVLAWYSSYWMPSEQAKAPAINSVLLPEIELLLQPLRALTYGVALGCAEFLSRVFARFRKDFSTARQEASVSLPGQDGQTLGTIRG